MLYIITSSMGHPSYLALIIYFRIVLVSLYSGRNALSLQQCSKTIELLYF